MKKTLLLLPALLFCMQANAQPINDSLIVLFLSEPGTRPSQIFADGFESGNLSRLDANGDMKQDLVLEKEDDDGNLLGLIVIDGTTLGAARLDTLWRIQDVQGILDSATVSVQFSGFCDCDADGTREVVFATDNEVFLVDPRDPQTINWRSSFNIGFPLELRMVGLTDMTSDGFEDIVVVLPQARQVIVFGDNPATSARR